MSDRRARILVVDDDVASRVLMRAALHKAGYEVSLAADGDDALRQFAGGPFDMVMLDVEMPGGMSGHEVCAHLRANAGKLLPIVMVTGLDDVRSVQSAYQSGATDFIAKPINWALIGHRVRYLLRAHQTLLDLQAADARNSAILEAIPDLLFELDLEGRYVDYHSPRSGADGPKAVDFIGKTVAETLPPRAALVCMAALRAAHENGASTGMQFELPRPHGDAWFELSVSRKNTGVGQAPRFIVLSRDITERKDAEREILRLAYFDGLTGLPNRQSFVERVEREIGHARRRGSRLAVLFLDLDGFKSVNDTLGHSAGDLILQRAAGRLRRAMRRSDVVSNVSGEEEEVELARLGGDEFTALIVGIEAPQQALAVAQRILALMRRPFTLRGRDVLLTASIGIAMYPEDGEDGATLLQHADTAMYHAKETGRNSCRFYSASLTEHVMRRVELEGDLRLALDRKEFSLVYQPQIALATGRIRMFEALIRWNRPAHATASPLDFIPVAEESGLIFPIGRWALATACAEAARWQQAGHPVGVAVNLSPLQFKDANLVQAVLETLAQTGLAPGLLELEVTEGAVMEDTAVTMTTLNALRQHGVRIVLDDFGTGYSSLSYLKRMPLSKLKIDRSFVAGLPDDAENLAIVRAIVAMAGSLGLSVTAEGVETLEQAQALQRLSCDLLQGYYFAHPVAAGDIAPMLNRQFTMLPDAPHPGTVPPA